MNAQSQGQVYSRDPAGPKVEILGRKVERSEEVLTPLALQLLASLHRRFNARRLELLNARRDRQLLLDDGAQPAFLSDHEPAFEWPPGRIDGDRHDKAVYHRFPGAFELLHRLGDGGPVHAKVQPNL